jgi:hypothetical protein
MIDTAEEYPTTNLPIHHDDFFSIGEPPLWPPFSLCLRRSGRHEEETRDANEKREGSLNEEKVAPSGLSVHATQF